MMASKYPELTVRQHRQGDLYSYWPKGFREYIYNKNNGHCLYCGKKIILGGLGRDSLVIEHLENRIWKNDNLVPACKRCNSKKQDKKLSDLTNFILIFGG